MIHLARTLLFLCTAALVARAGGPPTPAPQPRYLNPVAIAADARGERAYVALHGGSAIALADPRAASLLATWPQSLPPTGVAVSPDGRTLAVTRGDTEGDLVLLRADTGAELKRVDAGFSPVSPVFVNRGGWVAVLNRFTDAVSFFDARSGRSRGMVAVTREPISAAASLDGARLFVGTAMPAQPATAEHIAVAVDVIDVRRGKRMKSISLPNGSTGLQALAITPDGRHVLATHIVGHYQVPTNQLERGWMNANALSVIDVANTELLGTVLLDDTTLGAANPWGVGVTADGKFLAVAHSGTHEVTRVSWPTVLGKLETVAKGERPPGWSGGAAQSYDDGWLERDLTVMTKAVRARISLDGTGPRALAIAGTRVLVAEYFAGRLAVLDFAEENPRRIDPVALVLGEEPPMTRVRKGELRFADARLCFQGWQSCLSCHPSVRADGLNWDLLNDGLGNPKQTKSMVFSHETPPAMAHGVRATAEVGVRAGIRFIQFAPVDEEQASQIDDYLKSLRPLPSPHLVKGQLSKLAEKGRAIYERVGCVECHPAPYYTDLKQHRVKHAQPTDDEKIFDTPTLREVWRTAPYLYDGRATTIEEALRIKDRGVANLSDDEMTALVEYVLSL